MIFRILILFIMTLSLKNCSGDKRDDHNTERENRVEKEVKYSLYIDVFNVYPEGVEIEVEGIDNFQNGMELPKGHYRWRVYKRGFVEKRGEVFLDREINLDVKLER
jgi:hypothetical protein